MTLERLSKKQVRVLKWCHSEKYKDYNSIICDGAVRSGKTIVMTVSFILWAMRYFDKASFAFCGKTIASTERNIITVLSSLEDITSFYTLEYSRSNNLLKVSGNDKVNYFYIFGGKDESSYSLIQGMTLSGVFFDEVALMPKSFVEQGIARTLSVPQAKLWFNCNPESPHHWFYKEWILDADGKNEKKSLHIHFTMNDNPTLSKREIANAKSLYQGVFRDRYIYGKWVQTSGLVYPMFSRDNITDKTLFYGDYYISIDYGTINPCSMGLWVDTGKTAVRIKEYYFNSKEKKRQLTDEEYYKELVRLAGDKQIKQVIVDPSAASFITTIKRHGVFSVRPAKNNVLDGIRLVSTYLKEKKILINERCIDCIREFETYSWDEKSSSDTVIKEFDHALDEVRYFCFTYLQYQKGYQPNNAFKKEKQKRALIEPDDLLSDWGE